MDVKEEEIELVPAKEADLNAEKVVNSILEDYSRIVKEKAMAVVRMKDLERVIIEQKEVIEKQNKVIDEFKKKHNKNK